MVSAGLLAILMLGASPAFAASELASAPPGATSCSGCHGARAGAERALPVIQGRPADEIVAALDAFRTGKRPATVMNRIAPGFSVAETRAIALWLSQQPAP
jgi:cytochrome c553